MKTILILIIVGNYGGVSIEKFRWPTEEICQQVAQQMNSTKVSQAEVTAVCINNGDYVLK